ncbi:3052_t:CDS:2 [Funneliformis mosseae]|uniref:3052_t:CDS:1 n=1 Tax=Funneliformis mosseae TaxID=27381 RepID=A0A9N9A558_FUNMO|nr:3052_t:CDS:2 [Funneliformis mosseae]
MANYVKIVRELEVAKNMFEEATEELKKWVEGKYQGEKLNELEEERREGTGWW